MGTFVCSIIVIVVVCVVGGFGTTVVSPVVSFMVTLSVEPLNIPIVNQVIVWGQLCAAVIVIVVCIVKGLYGGALARGGERHDSFGEWALRTALAIAGVAMMPVFCNMVIALGTYMMNDVQGAGGSTQLLEMPGVSGEWLDALSGEPLEVLFQYLASGLLVAVVVGACVKGSYDMLKREAVLLVVCVVSPWVSVKGAMQDSDSYLDLLVSLLALCITQWVQYVFVLVGVSMFSDFVSRAPDGASNWFAVSFFSAESIMGTMMVLAILGAALAVPSVIERYAFSSGRGGAGAMVIGMVMRGGLRGIGRAPQMIGNALAGAAAGATGARAAATG